METRLIQKNAPLEIPEVPLSGGDIGDFIAAALDRIPAPDDAAHSMELVKTARALASVSSNDDAALAVGYSRDLAVCRQLIESHFDPYTSFWHGLHKGAVALRNAAVKPLAEEITRLDGLATGWSKAERARKAAEEEAARREAERVAREERERIERAAREEAARMAAERREQERIALEAAAKLESEGKAAAAEAMMREAAEKAAIQQAQEQAIVEQAALDAQDVRPAPILMPVPGPSAKQAIGSVGGSLSTYHKWELEGDLAGLLKLVQAAATNPEAYLAMLCVNEKTVNALVKAQGMMFRAPGIVVTEDERLSKRGKK